MTLLRSPRALRQHGAVTLPQHYRVGPQDDLAKGGRWLALLAAIALGSIGTGWLVAGGHAMLVVAAIVIAAVLGLALWAPGPLAALLLLAVLNGVPVVNLSGRLPGGAHFQDAAVIALIALLYVYGHPIPSPERSRLSRVATIWGACFAAFWAITVARSVLVEGIPPVKAALYGRDFLYFAVLLPLGLRARLPSASLRAGTRLFLGGVLVYAVGATAASLTGTATSWLVHPAIIDQFAAGQARVYSSMDLLTNTCLIFATAALVSGYARGRVWGVSSAVLLLAVVEALALTRANYFALAVAFIGGIYVYVVRFGSLSTVVVRAAVVVLAVTVVALSSSAIQRGGSAGYLGTRANSSPISTVVSRVQLGVSDLSQSTGTVAFRENLFKQDLHVLGASWPIGLGFLHPAARYVAGVPGGTIRNSDTGVLNILMTMGLLGASLIYAPLAYGFRELLRAGNDWRNSPVGVPRWTIYGGIAWIAWAVAGSPTLIVLFSVPGLVVTGLLLGALAQTITQPRSRV
jgi:hypothetical protein